MRHSNWLNIFLMRYMFLLFNIKSINVLISMYKEKAFVLQIVAN